MRKFITLLCLALFVSTAVYAQSMSDDQVVEYVKESQKMGKSQNEITRDLLRRGVTKEQVLRIKKKYEKENPDAKRAKKLPGHMRRLDADSLQNKSSFNEDGPMTLDMEEGEDEDMLLQDDKRQKTKKQEKKSKIFGHNMFTNRRLTFEPSNNMATPPNYQLGPGDEVIIHIWGATETTIQEIISPEGNIQVSGLGPVYLNGMTVEKANAYLQQEFAKIYSTIGSDQPSSQIKLTLGAVRSIQVNIMGEVAVPGTYTLSAFSSVFHALYRAGGVNEIGTLRNIQVMRQGKPVVTLDVYQYIMDGKISDNIRLQEGDVIIVHPYQSLVEVVGKVKRPMFYEMKPDETMKALLRYSGNFAGDAYDKAVRVIRKKGQELQIYTVDQMDYSVFRLADGDSIAVDSVLNRYQNRVEVRGAVYREGMYQLDGEVNTVKSLIAKADGVRGDAFLNRALLDREHDDLSHEMIAVNLKEILQGIAPDIPLQKNDILYIPEINNLKQKETVSIFGHVAAPGAYNYAKNMSIEDLIVQSGGLLDEASTINITVTRRLNDHKSSTYNDKIGETFTFDLKDSLKVDGEKFALMPFDAVYVRQSPNYRPQQNVFISGEVFYAGPYAMISRNERLSDLVKKAGGVTPDAYVRGARLVRFRNNEEIKREADVLRMAKSGEGKDSISVEKLNISPSYTVGIDLEKAIANPGSDYDLVLREGDMLYIPQYINTVKISGAVMYPNTVLYHHGEKLKYYIGQAGGYGDRARKSKAYVIYLNGRVARLSRNNSNLIEPGCEIVVPSKGEKKKMSTAEILGMGSTTASIAAMIATMVNVFK